MATRAALTLPVGLKNVTAAPFKSLSSTSVRFKSFTNSRIKVMRAHNCGWGAKAAN